MEIDTSKIDLENGKILHQGSWLTADDLTAKIQEKMASGDMKIAKLASLLEELNTALESSQVLEARIILSKEQYEKLSLLSDGKINECVRQAILTFIGENDEEAQNASEVEFVVRKDDIEAEPESSGDSDEYGEYGDSDGGKGKTAVIKCSKCNAPIEIDMDNMPSEIRCNNCHARGVLKSHKNKPRFSDQFVG